MRSWDFASPYYSSVTAEFGRRSRLTLSRTGKTYSPSNQALSPAPFSLDPFRLSLSGISAAVAPPFAPRNVSIAHLQWSGIKEVSDPLGTWSRHIPSSFVSVSQALPAFHPTVILPHVTDSCNIRSYQVIPTSRCNSRIPRLDPTTIMPSLSRSNNTRQRPLQLRSHRDPTSREMGTRSSPPHHGT
jgi:hypothetical protein